MRYLCVSMIAGAVLAGCGGEDVTLTNGCDIRKRACQELVFDLTSRVRLQTEATRPPVRTIGVEQLESEFRAALDEDDPQTAERQRMWDTALQLLGLLGEETPVTEAVVDDAVDSLQAYYDGEEERITIVDRGGDGASVGDVATLAHEFVHALQDQRGQLEEFRDEFVDSTDSSVATTSLIEGEATLLGAKVTEFALPPDQFLSYRRLQRSIADQVFETIDDSPEPFIAAIRNLPYTVGLDRLEPLRDGAGQAAVERLYEEPILSLRRFALVGEHDGLAPLDCQPTGAPAGYEAVAHDRLGVVGPMALDELAGAQAEVAFEDALAWTDDRMVVFRSLDEPFEYAVAWRVRFEHRLGVARLEASLGAVTDAPTEPIDLELLVHAAEDPGVMDAWAPRDTCGTIEDLPERLSEDDDMMSALRTRAGAPLRPPGGTR